MLAYVPLIAQSLVSLSSKVAVDSAVKMIVPVGLKALPSFGIKMGTVVATSVIGLKLGRYVKTVYTDLVTEVQNANAQEVEPAQEDN